MASPSDPLLRRWSVVAGAWGGDAAVVAAIGRDVLVRYAEPHRRYHDREHVTEVLAAVDELAGLAADPAAVELAAWLHDVVYDPTGGAGTGEEASAVYAVDVLARLSAPALLAARVARLIRLTADHRVDAGDADPADAAVLCDADLWILGATPDRYRRYAADVRAEYGFLDDAEWRAGRSRLLRSLADRPRLYLTGRAARWEPAARRNIAAELAALGG